MSRRDPRTDRTRRTSAIVCGHVGSGRSEIGMALARSLHRPCVDIATAAIARPDVYAPDPTSTQSVNELHWFRSIIEREAGCVVVAPCSIVPALSSMTDRDRMWVVWIDVDDSTLVERAVIEVPDLDLDSFERHRDRQREHLDLCDEIVPAADRPDDQIVDDVRERFHQHFLENAETS